MLIKINFNEILPEIRIAAVFNCAHYYGHVLTDLIIGDKHHGNIV